ncbi:MAG TPA: glycosyltransferase family 4 protein [Chloroflexota bacterium]|nr:glycosyltransferase family 4 protein [Chloroflexota bacterium]
MRRTVLYYTDSVGFGGAELALLHMLAGLDRRRWHPVLVHHAAPGIAPLLDGARTLGVERRAVPRMGGRRHLTRVLRFVRDLLVERPAIFHAYRTTSVACTYGLIAAALARVPAIVTSEQLFTTLTGRRNTRMQRLVALGVHRYIAVSQASARDVRRTLRLPARKVDVVYNGIPLAPLAPRRCPAGADVWPPRTQGAERRRALVLTPARLHPQKGHCYLLRAAALVPDAMFVLAGDGPERAALAAEARALGVADRVTFLGWRDDIPDLLAHCDLCVLPSLYEGFPLAVLEAMAAEIPVVASAIGGIDEAVIHGETGLLVPPADPAALATAITTILSDRALARRLARAGKERVQEHFSAQTMAHHVMRIYDELLDSRTVPDGRH